MKDVTLLGGRPMGRFARLSSRSTGILTDHPDTPTPPKIHSSIHTDRSHTGVTTVPSKSTWLVRTWDSKGPPALWPAEQKKHRLRPFHKASPASLSPGVVRGDDSPIHAHPACTHLGFLRAHGP
jgi:hypothetical protein